MKEHQHSVSMQTLTPLSLVRTPTPPSSSQPSTTQPASASASPSGISTPVPPSPTQFCVLCATLKASTPPSPTPPAPKTLSTTSCSTVSPTRTIPKARATASSPAWPRRSSSADPTQWHSSTAPSRGRWPTSPSSASRATGSAWRPRWDDRRCTPHPAPSRPGSSSKSLRLMPECWTCSSRRAIRQKTVCFRC